MRGKAKELPPRQCYLGITPAYAGKSFATDSLLTGSQDHPRVCGEKIVCYHYMLCHSGSPPRMRGKVCVCVCVCVWITPAYAGKSTLQLSFPWLQQDHPRVCGEKLHTCGRCGCQGGSPPRMRGKVKLRPSPAGGGRITPAYAGKRRRGACSGPPVWDHPRVCGEKYIVLLTTISVWGSPPRMRGKVRPCGACQPPAGITPAYAGKRAPFQKMSTLGRDHPRVCGEKRPSDR